jgi:hypothetical protein
VQNEPLELDARRAERDRQGGEIVKTKVGLGVLAVTGILALSVTVAQAGGAGTPVALKSFFVCQSTNGGNLGRQVDIDSDEIAAGSSSTPTAVRTLVTIGQAVLACAQAALFNPGTNDEISPNFGVSNPQELKCYSASTQRKSGDTGLFNAQDALWGDLLGTTAGTEPLSVSRDVRLICGPAVFSEPPPPSP